MSLELFPRRAGQPRVLIVDDEPGIRRVLADTFAGESYSLAVAENGRAALEHFLVEGADLVLADLMMPEMGGLELLRRIKSLDDSVAFILLTGAGTMEQAIEALRLQADDYLLKPFNVDEVILSARRALEHQRLVSENRAYQRMLEERVAEQAQQLEHLFLDGLLTIANAVEARDAYTGGHLERVTVYAVATGAELGLDEEALRDLVVCGLLHDIGKVGVPDHILRKPGELTGDETSVMRRHPLIGAAILERSAFLRSAAQGVLHHHERWDGGGYPFGLAGAEISLSGRILAVADAFDAMVTTRPYRGKCAHEEARAELERCAGSQFDPQVVEAFGAALDAGLPAPTGTRYIPVLMERVGAHVKLAQAGSMIL
jgi:response regulator RpfG family c-di-GMP phosphodiesterase